MKIVRSTTCCSSANLGSGFDSFGIALDAFKLLVTVDNRESDYENSEENTSSRISYGKDTLPGFLASKMCEEAGYLDQYVIGIESAIPVGKGLGSSGAVSVGVVAAMNKFLGLNLSEEDMISWAMIGEGFACGSRHGDNVTASLLGGFTIIHSSDPVLATSVHPQRKMKFMIIIPEIYEDRKTESNRSLIPDKVTFKDSVANIKFANAFMIGMQSGQRNLLSLGMNDNIVERVRAQKYSFLYDIKSICRRHNSIGTVLSGSGPSILSFIDEDTNRDDIKRDLNSYFTSRHLNYSVIYSDIGEGVKIE